MEAHAGPDPRRRDASRRRRGSLVVGGRVITSMALVAAVVAATSTAGVSAPEDPVGPPGIAAPVSATLALHVPADASLDDPGLDDASAPGWSGSLGGAAEGGASPAAGLAGLTGSILTPATVRAGVLPPRVRAAYVAAADRLASDQPGCGLPWWLLAGVGQVESGHAAGGRVRDDGVTLTPIRGPRLDGTLAGTAVVRDSDRGSLDGDAAYDRAVGPMQFMPGTWASSGADGDGDGRNDPDDVDDAALAAARYLCSRATGGELAEQGGQAAALFRYNRSVSYGLEVMRWGIGFRDGTAAPAAPSFVSVSAPAPTSVPRPAPSGGGGASPAEPPAASEGADPSAEVAPEAGGAPAPDLEAASAPDLEAAPAPDPEAAPAPDPEAAPAPDPEVPADGTPSGDPAEPPVPPVCVEPEEPSTDEPATGDPTAPEPMSTSTAAPVPSPSGPSEVADPSSVPGEPSIGCPPPCVTDEDGAPSPTGTGPSGGTSSRAGPSPSALDDPTDAAAPPLCAPAPPEEPEPTAPGTAAPSGTDR